MAEVNKKTILIAEDEKPIAKAMQLKLTSAGFEATVVSDGQEALDWLQSNKADLVLMDLVMPTVDGFGVLAKLKEEGSSTPVIVMSNLSQEDDIKRAKELGAVDYFVKSDVPVADIVKNVERVLGSDANDEN